MPMCVRVITSVLVLISVLGFSWARAAESPAPALTAPPGITFGDVMGDGASAEFLWRYLAAATGKPLYTFDAENDSEKPACTGACTREFMPYLAAPNAKADGAWTLVARGPKEFQWAYKGRPLYSFNGADPAVKRIVGLNQSPLGLKAAMLDPASELFSPKMGWRRAAFTPNESVSVPSGMRLKSLAVANGYVFVNESTGMPLYVMRTAPKNPASWMPMYAPILAKPLGDFSIIAREDGRRQWAYVGRALYSYRNDYASDDLNGLLEQSDVRLALANRHFLPRGVRIEVLPHRGPLLVTAAGMSLYTVARNKAGGEGVRRMRGGYKTVYDEAKAVGTRACEGSCLESWRPLAATAQDQASGFWEIMDRPDGSRQWAYKGSPLYTYIGDKKLGDIEGNDRRVPVYGDAEGNVDLALTGGDRDPANNYAGSGWYWHLVSFYN